MTGTRKITSKNQENTVKKVNKCTKKSSGTKVAGNTKGPRPSTSVPNKKSKKKKSP